MENQKKSRNNSIVVQSAILASAQILVRVIGLLYRVPMQRIIGDEGNGYYGLAYTIYQFILLLSANGIPTAVALLTARHLARREYKNVFRILKGAFIFALIIGGAVSLLTLFGAEWLAVALYGEDKIGVAISLRILAPTLFISAIMGVMRGFFQGKNSMMPTAVSQMLEQVVHAIISVVAAYLLIFKGPAWGAAGGTLVTLMGALSAMIFMAIVYYLYKPAFMRLLGRDKTRNHLRTEQIVKMVAVTMAPVVLSSTIYQISGIVDSSMFSKIMSGLGYASKVTTELYGNYSGQYQMILNIPLGITSSIGIALIPAVTSLVAVGRKHEAREKIDSILKLTNVIAIPSCVGLIVLAGPIMKLLFVINNNVPIYLLQLGAITVITYSFSTVTIAILQGMNKMKTPVINAVIALVIHIVVVYILLQFADMNIYSLVYGNLVFSFAMCALNLMSLYRYIGYSQEIFRAFVLPTAAALIMGAIAYFVYKGVYYIVHMNLISIVFSVAFGVAAYGIALILLGGMSEEEVRSLPKGHVLVRFCRKIHIM